MNDKFLVLLIVCLATFTGYAWIEIWQNRESHPLLVQLLGENTTTLEPGKVSQSSHKVSDTANPVFTSRKEKNEPFEYLSLYKNSLILQCRRLLREEKYAELNALLAGLEVDAEQDVAKEARLFLAYKAFDESVSEYEENFSKWVSATPKNYQPYLARAEFYYDMAWKARGHKWASETKEEQFDEMNRYLRKASGDLDAALEINNRNMVIYSLLIRIIKTGADKEAMVTVLNAAIEKNPATYEVRRVFVYAITPKWGGSYDMMQGFAKYSQQSIGLNPRLSLLLGAAYREYGSKQSSDHTYSKAIESYTKALNAGESHDVLGDRGETYYRMEEYEKAIADLSRAVELYPEEYSHYYWRSKTYYKLEKVEQALEDIEVALMLAPYDENNRGQHERVIWKLDNLGYEQAKLHNYDKALRYYDLALRSAPENAAIYSRRASVYIDQNKFDAAKADIREAIRLDPKTINYYRRMDWLLAREKKWDQIIAYWDQFIELDPNESWAYLERGGAYYHKRDMNEAVRNLKIAADMGNAEGRKAYERYKHLVK